MEQQDLDHPRQTSLVDQVMVALRKQIASRQTAPGVRLPSIRAFARKQQVSKSTVVEAYDRLAAEGVIRSHPGSGFYVAGHFPPLSLADIGPDLDRAVDPIWMTRQSLVADENLLKPGCGWLPDNWMPETDIRRGLRKLARQRASNLTGYSTPLGLPALRQLLSRRLANRGIAAPSQQIMLCDSGTQAIDLLCRFLLEPGDTVVLDDPCYFNFHAMLRAHRVKVVSVAFTPDGPDISQFKQLLTAHSPRLYITNSGLHNPTGASLTAPVAHRILKLAEQHDLLIIEDDIFSDFETSPAPRLAALDGLERVLHIGSFSKTLSAAVRCGFIATGPGWIEELVDLKLATSFGGGAFSSELVLTLLQDGAYRRHITTLQTRLADARGRVTGRLGTAGLDPWLVPNAGMFLWCRLPGDLDAADVARAALSEGLVLAPGNAFSLNQNARSYLRFNAAQSLNPDLIARLERAMEHVATH